MTNSDRTRNMLDDGVVSEKHKLAKAARLIRDYCAHTKCSKCIFDYYGDCMFVNMNDPDNFYHRPWNWETHAIGHGRRVY